MEKFQSIEVHYVQQVAIAEKFYNSVLEMVGQMKSDHIEDLFNEQSKYEQISVLEAANLKIHLDEINSIREDLENSIVQIAREMDPQAEGEYRASMKFYRSQVEVFSLKMEENADSLKEMTTYNPLEMDNKIKKLEDFLMDIWTEHQPPGKDTLATNVQRGTAFSHQNHGQRTVTVKNVHDLLPEDQHMRENTEGQGAFRNLFSDEDDDKIPAASPQFKLI